MENLEKLPPQALEMEANVLGAMLIDREAAGVAVELLRPEDFYKGAHRKIFEVAREIYDRDQALDQALLRQMLADRGLLEEVGGAVYVADLAASVATSAHIESYAAHVKDRSLARALIAAATEVVRDGFEPGRKAVDLLEAAEQRIYAIGQDRAGSVSAIREILEDLFAKLESHHGTAALTGIPTGFRDIDEVTSGLQPGELIILAGRPSTGKTTLALNILNNIACDQGLPVALFSLEMTKEQVAQNLACLNAGVDSHKLRRGRLSREEWVKLETEGKGRLKEAPIFLDDCPEPRIVQLRAKARRLRHKNQVGLVIFDYLQLIQGPPEAAGESRQQEVAAVSRSLKALARELKVPVIAVCQLNRGLEERTGHRPQLSDLRESGAIEQDADVVLLIHRAGLYKDPPVRTEPVTLIIAKNRNGPIADLQLTFLENCFQFRDYFPESMG
jgi:replicative DNA helicase